MLVHVQTFNASHCFETVSVTDRSLFALAPERFGAVPFRQKIDNVQTERFRYAPKRNEAVLLVRIDVTTTISQ